MASPSQSYTLASPTFQHTNHSLPKSMPAPTHVQKNKQRRHNKRYSKCGYACSLKHLKSLHTFVLADS